jgi:very-short-patch-repair endonuclease
MLAIVINSFLVPFLKMLPLIILVAVGGIIIKLLPVILKKKSGDSDSPMPYEKIPFLLTKAENSFYQVLRHILGSDFHIYPKVRISDIVKVEKGTKNRQAAFNRIQSKHVDFLLCNQHSRPVLVIELDDSSHNTAKAQKTDRFKDELFKTVGLRCVRIPASSSYNTEQIKSLLMPPKKTTKEQQAIT